MNHRTSALPHLLRVFLCTFLVYALPVHRACAQGVGSVITTMATLRVTGPVLKSISLAPTSLVGGTPSTATITLSAAAPTGGFEVDVKTDSSSFTSVPSTVTVAAGDTTAEFKVGTSQVSTASVATISASAAGVTKSAKLTVDPVKLTSLVLNPTGVIGGSDATGTVTIGSTAPTGGVVIDLSSNVGSVTVPTTVKVAAGALSAKFKVTTTPLATDGSAKISASLNGVTKTASLYVAAPTFASFTLTPSSVNGGASTIGTATLTGPAPEGGYSLVVTSSTYFATPAGEIKIPAGASKGTTTISTDEIQTTGSASISASLNKSTKSALLTVIGTNKGPADSAWPMVLQNAGNTGQGIGKGATGKLAWSYGVFDGSVDFNPIIGADGTIYTTVQDGDLLSVTPSGTKKWRLDLGDYGGATGEPPAIARDGTVYVTTWNGLVAVKPGTSSATVNWVSADKAPSFNAVSIGVDGTVYMVDGGLHLVAINPTNGSTKWINSTTVFFAIPTLGRDGTIYEVVPDGSADDVVAIAPTTGKILWTAVLPSTSYMLNQEGHGLTVSPTGVVYCVVVNGDITPTNSVYAVSDGTATSIYTAPSDLSLDAPATLSTGGTLYVPVSGSTNGILALTPSGAVASTSSSLTSATGEVGAPVIGADGTLYVIVVVNGVSEVVALNPKDGTVVWTVSLKTTNDLSFSIPAIGADGTLYIDGNGILYAVK